MAPRYRGKNVSPQEILAKCAENRRECAHLVRRCRSELRDMRAMAQAAIIESRLLMQEVDILLYARPRTGCDYYGGEYATRRSLSIVARRDQERAST